MFTFAAMPVKFVALLVLFAWCTVWCGYELTRPQDGRQRVSNILHLVMAVVMLLMVAGPTWKGLTALVPGPVLLVVFALSTMWFAWLAIEAARTPARRGWPHFAGHSMMFGAMTWHLAAMVVMAGMGGHSRVGGMEAARQPGGVLWVFALVGLPFMTYLLAASALAVRNLLRPRAAVDDACPCGEGCACGPECACSPTHAPAESLERELAIAAAAPVGAPSSVAPVAPAHSCHEERPVGSAKYRLTALGDFAMNFGMFWMSTGLMVAILPFFAGFGF